MLEPEPARGPSNSTANMGVRTSAVGSNGQTTSITQPIYDPGLYSHAIPRSARAPVPPREPPRPVLKPHIPLTKSCTKYQYSLLSSQQQQALKRNRQRLINNNTQQTQGLDTCWSGASSTHSHGSWRWLRRYETTQKRSEFLCCRYY